jgi:hypothetical protein
MVEEEEEKSRLNFTENLRKIKYFKKVYEFKFFI